MAQIGVFIPIGNNGWLISKNAPQYKPSFQLNKQIVQKAEGYGLDFALSMIKLRGFGGATEVCSILTLVLCRLRTES
jgi:pyrimidine oxygenase